MEWRSLLVWALEVGSRRGRKKSTGGFGRLASLTFSGGGYGFFVNLAWGSWLSFKSEGGRGRVLGHFMHCADLTVHMAKNLSGGNLRNTQSIVLKFFHFYYIMCSFQNNLSCFFFFFLTYCSKKNLNKMGSAISKKRLAFSEKPEHGTRIKLIVLKFSQKT